MKTDLVISSQILCDTSILAINSNQEGGDIVNIGGFLVEWKAIL